MVTEVSKHQAASVQFGDPGARIQSYRDARCISVAVQRIGLVRDKGRWPNSGDEDLNVRDEPD